MSDLGPFAALLKDLPPGWVLAIIVAAILAYRSPLIIKELFAGVGGLLNGRSKKTGTSERRRRR